MKAIVAILFTVVIYSSVQAGTGLKPRTIKVQDVDLVLKSKELKKDMKNPITRLYMTKNSRVLKALSFAVSYDNTKKA